MDFSKPFDSINPQLLSATNIIWIFRKCVKVDVLDWEITAAIWQLGQSHFLLSQNYQ